MNPYEDISPASHHAPASPVGYAGPSGESASPEKDMGTAPQPSPLPRQIRHDLRSCLNQILGYSDLLVDEVKERGLEDLVEDLERIHRAGEALLNLVNQHVDPVSRRADNPLSLPAESRSISPPPTPAPDPVRKSIPQIPTLERSSARLLVVEDNPVNRDLLGRLLERHGYHAVLVEDGEQALKRLGAEPFDLVLLDLMMPGQNGFDVLQALKADPALCHLPVIMISALDTIDSVVRCIELGAEDYLPKPFDPVLLRARVGASLEKKRLHDREQELFDRLEANYHQLQRLEQLRDDLVHMIVHDMRTPLTSLLSGLQTVELLGEVSSDQAEFLAMAISGGQNLLSMINGLLDISKMESGSLSLERETLQASALVEGAIAPVETLANEKQLNLRREISVDLPEFSGDRDKLQRTLINLIGNAIKHTPEGGTITLKGVQEGDFIHFSVTDTGEGIPRDAFERIFEKFGQVEARQGGRKMSTGLGLTFCKLVVEAHGGTIGVESEPGQGSTFFFSIPIVAAEPKEDAEPL